MDAGGYRRWSASAPQRSKLVGACAMERRANSGYIRRGVEGNGQGATAVPGGVEMNQPQAECLDLYRSGLKNAVDLMKSSLASAERLQNQQMSAIRSALDQHMQSVNQLSEAKSVDDLMA